jgi:hypothetical protein
VRDENDEQAVALAGHESFAGSGQIVKPPATSGLNRQLCGFHPSSFGLRLRRSVPIRFARI